MNDEINYPRVVVGAFIFNENDELFLMKSPKWNNMYIVPGGGVNFKESLEKAVVREVKEETNLDVVIEKFLLPKDIINSKEYKKYKHSIAFDYKARLRGKAKVKLSNEGTQYSWKKPAEWLMDKEISKTVKEIIEKHFLDTESFEQKYQRALADYHNLQKQTVKEKEALARYATEQVVHEIIPVYDNLKLAIKHSGDAGSNNWLEGVKHVVRQFQDILNNLGVSEINPESNEFNYEEMEALDKEETDDEKLDGKISKVIMAGYKLKDKVIIPAKVTVYHHKK